METPKQLETLKQLRKDAGLTQQGLADLISLKVKVDRRTVTVWENKNVCPAYPIVQRLAEIFIKSTDEIYALFYKPEVK